MDVFHVYQEFFDLNQRFKNLIGHVNLPIQINVSTMSKSNLINYYKNMIKPNKNRINYLRLSNPFTVNIIFSPSRTLCDFIQLETLILVNIEARYLNDILKQLAFLPKLHSLVLTPIDYVQGTPIIFTAIFRLPKLKSCKLTCRTKYPEPPESIFLLHYKHSPIEHFVINCCLSHEALYAILYCLPKLRYLSINYLIGTRYSDFHRDPVVSKYLKHVSLNIDFIHFDLLEEILYIFFGNIEVLHLTTKKYAREYLNATDWEELILSYMPNLRIFDIHHTVGSEDNQILNIDLINRFKSSFWIENQWYFTNQYNSQKIFDRGVFYSTNPYRRRDYRFYWEFNIQENNFNSVKQIYIYGKRATNNFVSIFQMLMN